jgi:hypothetical protein
MASAIAVAAGATGAIAGTTGAIARATRPDVRLGLSGMKNQLLENHAKK